MANRFFELDKNSFSRYLGRGVAMLIELSHSEFSQTYHLINDTKALEINGITYQPFPFDITLPSQTEQDGTQFTFSNVNNYVANILSSVVTSNENILMQIYICNREEETADKIDFGLYEVSGPTITNEAATAKINVRHSLDYNIGTITYNKNLFPNLFY